MKKKDINLEIPAPRILSRPEHRLSRKNIDRDALKVMTRLYRHGFKAYLVGGSVRDLLLERTPKDFDISTDARPMQIKRLFNNCRIIGKRFRLAHILFRNNKIIEVSTFRKRPPDIEKTDIDKDSPPKKGDNTFGLPHEDALRRDLTINGLFYDISDFSIIDYVGGVADLEAGIIRTIGDPKERFLEDPIRMIRAIRHKIRTDLELEKHTYSALIKNAEALGESNSFRLKDELQKDIDAAAYSDVLRLHKDTGLLAVYFKALNDYLSLVENPFPDALFSSRWIWEALAFLDTSTEDKEVIRDLRLLSILFPLLEYNLRQAYPTIAESLTATPVVQELLKNFSIPFGIPRRNLDSVRMLWTGWQRLLLALESEQIPTKFQKKPYFDKILRWHAFHQSIAGCQEADTHASLQNAIRRGRATSPKRKRRRRRPKNPSPQSD